MHRLALFGVMFLASCSTFSRSQSFPETRAAVVSVVNDYLRAIAMANTNTAEGMVYWYGYWENNEQKASREQMRSVIMALRGRWKPEQHPLIGLTVVDVDLRGDNAVVTVQKPSSSPVIIKLAWSGGGWLVSDDNLFGPDGLLTKLAANTAQ